MKKCISTLAVLLIGMGTYAQINVNQPKISPKLKPVLNTNIKIDPIDLNMNMDNIRIGIESGKKCYLIKGVANGLFKLERGDFANNVVGYFENFKYLYTEAGYLRSDNKLLRNDKRFKSGNHFEVLIYPDRNDKRLVNKNMVKVTWWTPELQLRTFSLKNVSVRYQKQGILITGDHEIEGNPMGFSFSITQTTCLQ
ncbi:hypothetical protein [Sediminicola luteus]|nr:hypothetical protein [Sediminicola luteus]